MYTIRGGAAPEKKGRPCQKSNLVCVPMMLLNLVSKRPIRKLQTIDISVVIDIFVSYRPLPIYKWGRSRCERLPRTSSSRSIWTNPVLQCVSHDCVARANAYVYNIQLYGAEFGRGGGYAPSKFNIGGQSSHCFPLLLPLTMQRHLVVAALFVSLIGTSHSHGECVCVCSPSTKRRVQNVVSVDCYNIGEARLVDGAVPYEGLVEVCTKYGSWGAVGNNYWGSTDASVVCRELGYQADGGW